MKSKRVIYKLLGFIFLLLCIAGSEPVYGKYHDSVGADSLVRKRMLSSPFNLRFYPLSLADGQLSGYTMEFRLVFEYRYRDNNSFQFGGGVDIPGPPTLGQLIVSGLSQVFPPKFYGGRFDFEYRHYYNVKIANRIKRPFLGGGVSLNGMISNWTGDQYDEYEPYTFAWFSPSYKAHVIMANAYATTGFQTIKRNRKGNYRIMDIAFSGGVRYDYFWKHFQGIGNNQYPLTGIYWWYHTVPVCGSISFTFGGTLQ